MKGDKMAHLSSIAPHLCHHSLMLNLVGISSVENHRERIGTNLVSFIPINLHGSLLQMSLRICSFRNGALVGSPCFALSLYHHGTPVKRIHQSYQESCHESWMPLCAVLCAACSMPSAVLTRAKCASGIYQISGFLPVLELPSGTVLLPCSLQVPAWLQYISVLLPGITSKALADIWHFVSLGGG